MRRIKSEIEAAIESVQTGELDRGVGAVVFQGYNILMRAVEIERKVRETDEVEERLLNLERDLQSTGGQVGEEHSWGA
jgi:hypothetical protein